MGMYTEVMVKLRIEKNNSPKDVVDVLMFLFADKDKPELLPDHPYFSLSRWEYVGNGSSFYHHPGAVKDVREFDFSDEIYIFARNDFKNYGSEIQMFFDWVDPYLSNYEGQCIGYSWYEEDDQPTLIYKK